jgi:hypothetical protein
LGYNGKAPWVKVALYTAIYGPYDWVKPVPSTLGVPAYLYTDSKVTADKAEAQGWEPRIVNHSVTTLNGEPTITEPMLNHKWWKCRPDLACPDADVSLWIDGSMTVVSEDYVDLCIAALGDDDWVCVPHPARYCVYPEGEFSATLIWRYDGPSIKAQIAYYRSLGFPVNWGLFATGANVRRHTPQVIEIGKQWWHECITRSHQDQLSLPVLFWLAGDKLKWNTNMPWFQWWELAPHGGG